MGDFALPFSLQNGRGGGEGPWGPLITKDHRQRLLSTPSLPFCIILRNIHFNLVVLIFFLKISVFRVCRDVRTPQTPYGGEGVRAS